MRCFSVHSSIVGRVKLSNYICRVAMEETGEEPASQKPVVHRWYLGGLASASAAACTHPLDLLKASV